MSFIIFPEDNDYLELSVMSRARLYNELDEHRRCRLIGIISDSGFGKTSLIQGYLVHRGLTALWCTFNENDSPEDDIRRMYQELRNPGRFDVIVFDNCSEVADDSMFAEAITSFITLKEGRTIILIGTALPRLPFATLRAKEQYFELSHVDLALDRAEIKQYYNDFLGMEMRDYELDFLYDRTHGWYISNQLIYSFLKKNHLRNLDTLDLNFLSDVRDINDYFSYNLYQNQSQEMQSFLLRTSPITDLNADTINLLLDIDDADRYLAELCKHHGFVYFDSSRALRLHPLFRQFLYERYSQSGNHKQLAAHRKLIGIYEKKRHYLKAFTHAVACNDYASANRLMTRIQKRYNVVQLFNIVDGHLEEISPDLLFSNTTMFLARCFPEEMMIQLIQPLAEEIETEPDTLRQAALQHRLGSIYYHLGNINMAFELLEKSLASAKLLRDNDILVFNYQLLADCHLVMGDREQALFCVRNALYLSEQKNLQILMLHTLEVFARIQLTFGEVDVAEEYIEQAMELASPDAYEVFWLTAVQSMIDAARGDAEQAICHAAKAAEIVIPSICEYDKAYTNLILARALSCAGRTDEAMTCLSVAYEESQYCTLLKYDILAEQLALVQEKEKKLEIKREMAAIAEENNYYWISSDAASAKQKNSLKNAPNVSIQTFGDFSITCKGMPVLIKRSASVRLLHLLLINRGQFISKDYIIDNLFPNSTASAGSNNFNVALSTLRKALDSAIGLQKNDTSCILREKDRYRLNADLVSIDADAFEAAYTHIKRKQAPDLNNWLELSVLYSKPFMQEYPYESILENERERLTAFQKDVALSIARLYAEKNDLPSSIKYYQQVFEYDPYDEDIYYEAIELLLDADSPGKAQMVASKMKLHIENELGISCSERLQEMFDYYMTSKVRHARSDQ